MFIFVSIALGLLTPQDNPIILTPEQVQAFDPIGFCEGSSSSIDLHEVMFLENRSLDIRDTHGDRLRVSVEGERLTITTIGEGVSRVSEYLDMDSEIDPHEDLDIELRLGYFDGKLVLYWKETYQNRFYRQGLFRITGRQVDPICAGQGGRQVER